METALICNPWTLDPPALASLSAIMGMAGHGGLNANLTFLKLLQLKNTTWVLTLQQPTMFQVSHGSIKAAQFSESIHTPPTSQCPGVLFLLFFHVFETGSHYVALTGLGSWVMNRQ